MPQDNLIEMTPGQALEQYFFPKYRFTQDSFSELTGMPIPEVFALLKDRIPMNHRRAHLLAALFPPSADFWFRLAQNYNRMRFTTVYDGKLD